MFCENFAFIMAPITKLMQKWSKEIIWIRECHDTWETIKWKYVKAPILIALNWDKEFHVHTYTFNLAIGAMLAQNLDNKCD
jgi:hypothetical protein